MSMYSGSRRSSLSRMRFGDFPPGYSGSRMGFVMPGICALGVALPGEGGCEVLSVVLFH